MVAKVTAVTTVFPYTGLPRFLLTPKNADDESKQTTFHTENARMLSVFCPNLLFLPGGRMLPRRWSDFQGGHGKANSLTGAVQTPPRCRTTVVLIPCASLP